MLDRPVLLARHLEEFEGAEAFALAGVARRQGAEALANLAIFNRPVQSEQSLGG